MATTDDAIAVAVALEVLSCLLTRGEIAGAQRRRSTSGTK
jgi:hypothetical protein